MADTNPEELRLQAAREGREPWRRWGPYLSERQWGTVREDYSANGDAWSYFSHDQARSRAYRWGEDGLAGFSDDHARLCFALALWNGNDPILKERLFGLTNAEGNHGEDVKEYYFYVDATPTHSWNRWLYKYPQRAYPYDELVATNASRTREEMEYELLDTGVFDDDRYFDVQVDYAKAAPDDILVRIEVFNRGPDAAPIHVLPTLWLRNDWTWNPGMPRPKLSQVQGRKDAAIIAAEHRELGVMHLYCEGAPEVLFTENETNNARLFGTPNATPYVKDAFHRHVVDGEAGAVNPARTGTKACAVYRLDVPARGSVVIRARLSSIVPQKLPAAFGDFDAGVAARKAEADRFYDNVLPRKLPAAERLVARQALAGMLWGKQHYYFDVDRWLDEHKAHPLTTPSARPGPTRNAQWFHMVNDDVVSMPDKWEYPWYAAWDLAFHTVALAVVDADFAKQQLELMLRERYLHPNGQIPAYEWNFGDVNPPVHAFATWFVYVQEKQRHGQGDLDFLQRSFQKLLLNFTWWVNRKDPAGRNVFEGGFLGLDNIGVFDRSSPLPTGGRLEQADGTAWMALFAQNMLQIAVELAVHDPSYESMVVKFVEHFLWIAGAMDRVGDHHDEMWDEEDGFFYDLLRLPDGTGRRMKVRSMVGLLPLCASTVFEPEFLRRFPAAAERMRGFIERHSDLCDNLADPRADGVAGRRLLAIVNEDKLRRILARMLDENRFLSPYGIRSLSRAHLDDPYRLEVHGETYEVKYIPAESNTGMFGGNSNWRGPVWFPVNALLVRALVNLYRFHGDALKVECPTGSGVQMTLYEVAREITRRLAAAFLPDATGKRPVYGGAARFQTDPHWKDLVLFYEYFHGDNGAGLGASHQTGWTGLVAPLMAYFAEVSAAEALGDKTAAPVAVTS
jgi:hypothetical protein